MSKQVKEADQEKPKSAAAKSTEQNPKATVNLSKDKVGDPAFNQGHLASARAKHLASNDQKIVRHPGQDSQHSKNTGTLNQE
jgi:hypothetical protein